MKCTMVFSSSAAALPGRREWAGGQPAVALTLVNILVWFTICRLRQVGFHRQIVEQTFQFEVHQALGFKDNKTVK